MSFAVSLPPMAQHLRTSPFGTLSDFSPTPTSGKHNYIVPENKRTCLLELVESSPLLSIFSVLSSLFWALQPSGTDLKYRQPLLPVPITAFCHMTSFVHYLISQGSIYFPFIQITHSERSYFSYYPCTLWNIAHPERYRSVYFRHSVSTYQVNDSHLWHCNSYVLQSALCLLGKIHCFTNLQIHKFTTNYTFVSQMLFPEPT